MPGAARYLLVRKWTWRRFQHLTTQPEPAFAGIVQDLRDRLAAADWRVLSARRANLLLTEKLFERVFAVRIRSFNRSYRNAELDMHFSLAEDMTPIQQFLKHHDRTRARVDLRSAACAMCQ